jgi:hypothetical protein
LNSQGNWIEIAKLNANRFEEGKYHVFNTLNPTIETPWTESTTVNSINGLIYLQLEVTNLNSPNLTVLSEDGSKLYHHFKVIAENHSGIFSKEENILTIYNEISWTDVGGISNPNHTEGMIIGATFRVR